MRRRLDRWQIRVREPDAIDRVDECVGDDLMSRLIEVSTVTRVTALNSVQLKLGDQVEYCTAGRLPYLFDERWQLVTYDG